MKAINKVCLRQMVSVFLVVAVGSVLAAGVLPVFAEKDPCALELKDGKSLPDSFNVRDCLTAPGQTSRVPAGQPAEGEPTGILKVIMDAIDLLIKLIAAIALIVFIIGALLTVASEGKEDRLEKGKSAMMFALIGLVVSLFSFVIVTFVQSILFYS